MRLAIPTLILAIILVLGWRVCSGGEGDHLRLTAEDLPAEMRQGYEATSDEAREAAESSEPDLEARTERAESAPGAEPAAAALAADGADAEAVARGAAQAVSASSEPDPGLQVAATGVVEADALDIEAPRLPSVSASSTPPSAAAASEPEAGRIYIVQPGDWLMQIARDQYGDAAAAKKIARRNGLDDADQLKPGQKLVLP